MIAACGFEGRHPWIREDTFPLLGTGIMEFEADLFEYQGPLTDGYCNLEAVEAAVMNDDRSHPWELPRIEHLLACVISLPKDYVRQMIVALGERARRNLPPYVQWSEEDRPHLKLDEEDAFNPYDYYFLRVRPITVS